MALLAEGERFYKRSAQIIDQLGGDGSGMRDNGSKVEDFRRAVEARLPHGFEPLSRLPSVETMAKASDKADAYLWYVIGSQYTHSTYVAGRHYRTRADGQQVLKESINPADWVPLMRLAWWSLTSAGKRLLERLGASRSKFLTAASFNGASDLSGV